MKNLKKFKIEELEQRLEMDGEWKSTDAGEPGHTSDASAAAVVGFVVLVALMIILL